MGEQKEKKISILRCLFCGEESKGKQINKN